MRGGKCLIVRLVSAIDDRNSLKWDLPGGRIDVGEEGETAFKRELLEEIGITVFTDLNLPNYRIYIPGANDSFAPFCGIIRLVEIGADQEIKLSFEHDDLRWISPDEVNDYEYIWEGWMKEMIKKSFDIYKVIKK